MIELLLAAVGFILGGWAMHVLIRRGLKDAYGKGKIEIIDRRGQWR